MSPFWKGMLGGLVGTFLAGSVLGFSSWVALHLIEAQEDITKMNINMISMQSVLVDRIEDLSRENARLRRLSEVKSPTTVDEPPEQTQGTDPIPNEFSKEQIMKDIYEQRQQQQLK